ncbi:xyloglucan-specific endo-beta-1,4-glucanase A [Colletotrichum cereale]|nr:xyloglucan-specific endo-beta-1,4-glucanase A [Colletotrichum cereale]
MCGSSGSVSAGGLTIYHNNYGEKQATSGSQCTTFQSLDSGSVTWSTSWNWAGGKGQVKSFSNVALENVNKPLSAIKSIPSKWTWSYTGSLEFVFDVAYDLWLAPSVGANNTYEIRIWLAAFGGVRPISTTGKAIDNPIIAATQWSLYSGSKGNTTVYTFVAPGTQWFDGDLMDFFNHLTSKQGVANTDVVTSLQAGTEAFSGSNAVFTTSAYTISVA